MANHEDAARQAARARTRAGREAAYERLTRALGEEALPHAVLDLDAFEQNLARLVAPLAATTKTLRLATKSVRSPDVLRRAFEAHPAVCRGLLCYAAREAQWLFEALGFDDLLVAYPSVQPSDLDALAAIARAGGKASIVVDGPAHLEALEAAARRHGVALACVLELDVSYRPLGAALHLGVRRSPLRSAAAVIALARDAARREGVRVAGLMAYEAHIAGLPDASPFARALNPAKRLFKRVAMPAAQRLRAEVVEALREEGIALDLVNAGGTGSLALAAKEPAVTEVTAGSGLYCPHLFDGYEGLSLEPACFFACQVVRASDPGFVTCMGGGLVASGEAGLDRLPLPWLPPGLALTGPEGAGEVQTPLTVARGADAPALGAPVYFRHAKAGEVCEHFDELLLVRGERLEGRARTYRGLGQRFP